MKIDITNPSSELLPGFTGTFLHGEGFTVAYWHIKKGAKLPEHHHHHEQLTQVTEGEFELTVGGEKQLCKPGSVLLIPGNIPHSGVALTDCKITDIFCPARPEYQ
ncbi:MAG: cupin domain-containing protein [Cyclobacteriaceae bacterium]|jgi:quercetin dioxygenase-like cupin family protein